MNVIMEDDIILVINRISLNRFSLGGAAILIAKSKNHHIDKDGEISNMPLVINELRV
jgi:hypothetical protein